MTKCACCQSDGLNLTMVNLSPMELGKLFGPPDQMYVSIYRGVSVCQVCLQRHTKLNIQHRAYLGLPLFQKSF